MRDGPFKPLDVTEKGVLDRMHFLSWPFSGPSQRSGEVRLGVEGSSPDAPFTPLSLEGGATYRYPLIPTPSF